MPLGVSYMGTKRQLAGAVADLVVTSQPGAFLDLFAGMCSVGAAIPRQRQVWSNDAQHFANLVARSFLCSNADMPCQATIASLAHPYFKKHRDLLLDRYAHEVALERLSLSNGDVKLLRISFNSRFAGSLSQMSDYDLFSSTYSGAYFGIVQCIEIDAIRYSIDRLKEENRISSETADWLVLALCQALSKCTTSTGHFAQPLAPKPSNIDRFCRQRSRSAWVEWVAALPSLIALGTRSWRKKNRAFHGDAIDLLKSLSGSRLRPKVIYADPPYTSDQYSRYYHLYETAILYDYPGSHGRGLYREGRSVSAFSLKARVASSIESLISCAQGLGADLIISYPTNGLMHGSRDRIPELMRKHYGRSPEVTEIAHRHSTMGASKGAGKASVTEVLYKVAA